jgi:hypothetical protein
VSSTVAIFPNESSCLIGVRKVQRLYPSPEVRGLKALGPDRGLHDVQQLALQRPVIPSGAFTEGVGEVFRHVFD